MTTSEELISAAAAAYTGLPITLDPADTDRPDRGFACDVESARVSGRFRVEGGKAQLTSITVTPDEGHLTSGGLRLLPYGQIIGSLTALASIETAQREGLAAAYPGAASAARKPVRKGGRPRVTEAHLASVAESYLRETAPGSSPRAVRRLAAEFSAPEETVRTWLHMARKDGWLAAFTKGRAGAEPGPRLLLWRMQREA